MLAPAGLTLALALALPPAPAAVGGPGDECSVDADCAPSLYYCCSSYCNHLSEKPHCDSWCMDCIEPEPEALTVHEMIDMLVS